MLYSLGDKRVTLVGSGHFIAPNAAVIGLVTLHENSSVWFNCVLRGDVERIEIGAGSNIQDGTVMHADPGFRTSHRFHSFRCSPDRAENRQLRNGWSNHPL